MFMFLFLYLSFHGFATPFAFCHSTWNLVSLVDMYTNDFHQIGDGFGSQFFNLFILSFWDSYHVGILHGMYLEMPLYLILSSPLVLCFQLSGLLFNYSRDFCCCSLFSLYFYFFLQFLKTFFQVVKKANLKLSSNFCF